MITPNVYKDYLQENVKKKLASTENFNAYARDNWDISLDPTQTDFYGANVLASAKDIYSGYVKDFQTGLGTAKADMSQGITNTANVYKDAIVNYDTQLRQSQNAYGRQQESLASAGLSDSGWEKYLDDNVYAQYIQAKQILQNQSADAYKAYNQAYQTVEQRADKTLSRQADTLATNVYGQLQGNYNAYKDHFNEATNEVVNAYSNVEKPTAVEGLNAYKDYLDEKTYGDLLGKVQGKNFEFLSADINTATESGDANAIANAWAVLDANRANVSAEQYSNAYLERTINEIRTNTKSKEDYDTTLEDIKGLEYLTETDKGKALAELNAIDREKLPATEKEAVIREKIKAIDEVAPESNKQTQGLQTGQLEAGDNTLGDLIEKGIEKISNNIAEKKVTTEHSNNDTKYSTIDSSTKYDIANASLTIGENITIKIGDSETKANLRYYAAKSTKEALKGMQAGEIKEHNGYLYLQGKNSLFRLDKSDTKALINAGYFK